jgi:predicted RNA-binding Zn ribbon-like protein
MEAAAGFPSDWLDPRTAGVASDLDLAVLLVNSYDALADPPDRLHDLGWLRLVLTQTGHPSLAAELSADDLGALHTLRAGLNAAFEASHIGSAAAVLNPMLADAEAVTQIVVRTGGAEGAIETAALETGVGRPGIDSLRARLPLAVARHVVAFGISRLGRCVADPCHCAFVDRTRAGTRRYCCGWCNDRAAARAYRKRRSMGE